MSTQKNKTMLVGDVMMDLDRVPVIKEAVILKEALEEMGRTRLGIVCIVNETNKLLGILTDGDIRRKLLKVQKPFSALFVDDALEHAIKSPVTCSPNATLVFAIALMEEKQIWDLPIVDESGGLIGLLHLHPAVQALLNLPA
jgi:CBS domain-containing protein